MQPATSLERTLAVITQETAVQLVGPATFSMGKIAAERGDVTTLTFNAERTEITAKVKGGGLSYTCWISQPGNKVRDLNLRCACATAVYCKHAMAALWAAHLQANSRPETWRDSLSDYLAKPSGGEPLALVIDSKANPPELSIRRIGSSGEWVAARASWTDMTSTKWASVTDGIRADHLHFIRRLWEEAKLSSTWVNSRAVTLQNLETNLINRLRQAQNLGINLFIDDTEQPVIIAGDEIELKLDSYTLENGDLELTVVATYFEELIVNPRIIDGPTPLVLFGETRLIPISENSLQLAHPAKQRRRIRIPAADVAEYETQFLPYLTHLLTSTNVLHGPTVVAGIDLNGHQLEINWRVEYESPTQTLTLGWNQALKTMPNDTQILTNVHSILSEYAPREWGLNPTHATLLPLDSLPRIKKLAQTATALNDHLQWRYSEALKTLQISRNLAQIRVSAPTHDVNNPDWFNLEVTIEVDGQAITVEEILHALEENRSWVTTEAGTWAQIDLQQLNHLRALLEGVADTKWGAQQIRIPKIRLGMLSSLDHYGVITTGLDKWIDEVTNLVSEEPERTLAVPNTVSLRPYQATGSGWLDKVTNRGFGAVLADDMGLGKTLQILTTIETKRLNGELQHGVLVVAPTSVISVWESETKRFYPQLKAKVVRESSKKRKQSLTQLQAENDLLITSWTLLQMDQEEYRQLTFDGVVFDEAQAMKNPRTAQHRAAKNLRANWKIASTGTPIENSLGDLWAIMRVINPGLLPGHTVFHEEYGKRGEKLGDTYAHQRLQALLQPFMKRRTKRLVAPQLPPKIEQTITVQLDDKHRRLYERYLNQHRKELLSLNGDARSTGFKVITGLNQLRQLALDPALVEPDGKWGSSAKTDTLLELLQPLLAEQQKSLVFSQYTSYLQRVKNHLEAHGIRCIYLDGATQNRAAVVEKFRNEDAPVFLISLKAGGTGLTLTEAENVFILDPWWNPATENQAIDRAHRIGQDKTVNVYRLCATDTIEEKVMALQAHKREVADAIVGENVKSLSPEQLRSILT